MNTGRPTQTHHGQCHACEVQPLVDGVLRGDRAILARAISRVESTHPRHQQDAAALLQALMPSIGRGVRIGITGVPGAGKSSLIERLGQRIIDQGKRVAVLAIDPSSVVTGGSILGDRTRMSKLAGRQEAFIRPSPSGRTLGGVARRTREAAMICEAAGFDVVLIETVGVGQSETVVADMVDAVLALGIAGSGDQLQGLKRGVLEIVDFVAINKADGDNQERALAAAADLRSALTMLHTGQRTPPVSTCSALTGSGVDDLWHSMEQFLQAQRQSGEFARKRSSQMLAWMHAMIEDRLLAMLRTSPAAQQTQAQAKDRILSGQELPAQAAQRVIAAWVAEVRAGAPIQEVQS